MSWYVFKPEEDQEGYFFPYQRLRETDPGPIWAAVRLTEPYSLDEPVWNIEVINLDGMIEVDQNEAMTAAEFITNVEGNKIKFFNWLFSKGGLDWRDISGHLGQQ